MTPKVLVIIPAKADSTRLIGKNKRKIAGMTLVEHAIDYAKSSTHVAKIIVSTEDPETRQIAQLHSVDVVGRDPDFMGEREVADVYVRVFEDLSDNCGYTHVVGIQPDHPDRTTSLDDLICYAIKNKYDDLFTVNADGSRNGAVRIIKSEHLAAGKMSRRVGSVMDCCTNIHSEADLVRAEQNIFKKGKT